MAGLAATTVSTVISGIPAASSVPGGFSPSTPASPYVSGSGFTDTSNSLQTFTSLAGTFLEVLVVVALLSFVGVFVIIVVSNRADPDPSGRRPQTVYFFAVSFVTIGTTIIGSAVVVVALVQLIGHHSGSITNTVARAAVIGGLITLVSAFLLSAHLRRGLEGARSQQPETNPSQRVGQSYVGAVAFISVSTFLLTVILSIYLLFALARPGVFGSFGGSTPIFRLLVVSIYLGGVSILVLWSHRNLVPPGLGFLGRTGSRSPGVAVESATGSGSVGP
jgi:hypothetical protein